VSFILSSCATTETQSNSTYDNSLNYNVDDLNSYGEWIYVNPYGNVWRPYAVSDWAPFDNGHWSWINKNWTWVSYEPFGWIVYHYGYWYYDPFYGWVWIPSDGPWLPANVTWFNYDDYVCWAPLGPRGIVYRNPWEPASFHPWHVVRSRDFTEVNIHNYTIVNPPVKVRTNNVSIIRQQPGRDFIERSVGRNIPDLKTRQETVTLPKRQLQREVLPDQEKTKVNQNSARVKNNVLLKRDEFKRQQSERKR
jgi:hypothetical protein